MGCLPAREKKYVDAKTSADFLGNAPEYGIFMIYVEIHDNTLFENWSKTKKGWVQKSRQMILNFVGVSVVEVLPQNSSSLVFKYRIPFSKEGFKVFQKPFVLEFDYNNFYTGFTGVIQTAKILESFVSPVKEDTKISFLNNEEIPISVHYVLIGKNLVSDLKQLSLEGVPIEQQKESLLKAISFSDQTDLFVLGDDHANTIRSFWGGNTQEMLINAYLKHKNEGLLAQIIKAIDFYYEKGNEDQKQEANDQIPVFPANFEAIFDFGENVLPKYQLEQIVLKLAIKRNKLIFKSVPFFKKVVEMWVAKYKDACQESFFHEPKDSSETLQNIYQNSPDWFYEVVLKKVFQQKDPIAIEVFGFFMKNYPETRNYLLSIERKINFDALEGLQVGYFLKNYLYTPDFVNIQFKTLKFYGHVSGNNNVYNQISNVFKESHKFTSNPNESANISVIAEEKEGRPFVVTHFFLKSVRGTNSAVRTAVYFLQSEVPSEESIKKFHGFTKEKFDNGEFPQDDILKPVAFLDVKGIHNNPQDKYDEVRLNKPILGRILVCLFLEPCQNVSDMEIGNTGCFGFLGDQPENFDGLRLDGGGKRVFIPEDGKN